VSTRSPRLNIGLAVFDGGEFVGEAIERLLAQTYGDFRLIVSDNASSDSTEAICRRFAALDSRIDYYRNEQNRGAAWNINHVFELSTSEYFKWAAHDDVCAPEFLERCVAKLDHDPSAVLCYTDTVIIDEKGDRVADYVDFSEALSEVAHERFQIALEKFGLSNPFYGIVRSSALRGTRMIGAYPGSDQVLIAELALMGRIVKVHEKLFFRRIHPGKADRVNPTYQSLAEWYAPENKDRIQLENWRLFSGYVGAVWRASISRREKVRIFMHLVRWLHWNRRDILSEIVYLFRRLLSRTARPPAPSAR